MVLKNSNSQNNHPLSQEETIGYTKDGILVIQRQIFSPEKLEEITSILMDDVNDLPSGSETEFSSILNSGHLRSEKILNIAKDPAVVEMAAQLLKIKD